MSADPDQLRLSHRRLVEILGAMKERGLDVALLGREHWLGPEEAAWVFFHKEEAWAWAETDRARSRHGDPYVEPPWAGKPDRSWDK